MQNLLVPTDYVDNEVAKLRREVIEWKDQVKKELQQLRCLQQGGDGSEDNIQVVMDDLWPNKMVQDDSAGGAGADAADSGDADEEVDADMEDMICFDQESAWSIPLVLSKHNFLESIFGAFLMIMNATMQVLFTVIIMSPDFLGEGLSVTDASTWRHRYAHDLAFVGLDHRNLASIVCDEDGALIFSTAQVAQLVEINNYLGLEKLSFELPNFQPGMLLAFLCILLWNICIFSELRSVWYVLRGMLLSAGASTSALKGLSWQRIAIMTLVCVGRAVVAGALLISGTIWLGNTTSITELMLNAVALEAVLHIDEFICRALVPTNMQQKIKRLPPMQVRRSRRWPSVENVILACMLAAALLVPWMTVLVPLRETMLSVKREMCGGDIDFVIAGTSGQMYTALSVSTGAPPSADVIHAETAVHEILSGEARRNGRVEYSIWEGGSFGLLAARRNQVYPDFKKEFYVCRENDRDNDFTAVLQGVGMRVGKPGAKTCEELAYFCSEEAPEWLFTMEAIWLRNSCPRHCGCTQPLSSPLLKTPWFGCTRQCIQESYGFSMYGFSPLFGKPPNFTTGCKDQLPGPSWHHFWDNYFPMVDHYHGSDYFATRLIYLEFRDWAKAVGCPVIATQPQDLMGSLVCRGSSRYLPLAWFCPETCGCSASGNLERDHFCFAYDYCPMHVMPNETEQAWQLIRKYDLLRTLMNPELLFNDDAWM
ncbi:Protein NLRC3 [Durusdinium trenchii]|uniref:Protein NLRC3 n=2 Tax=Durusdinium trenchii TaxID=1381693 RepID=A0ABP0RJL5_9DINO